MKPLRPLGHPLHPAAVHLPMGLWLSVPAWDALGIATGRAGFLEAAYWCLLGGLVGAGAAALTGLLEAPAVPAEPAAERTFERHWMLALGAASAFALSAFLRGGAAPPGAWAVLSSGVGALLLAATGWHGGELVLKHGVGRDL